MISLYIQFKIRKGEIIDTKFIVQRLGTGFRQDTQHNRAEVDGNLGLRSGQYWFPDGFPE